jgi:TonB family protein
LRALAVAMALVSVARAQPVDGGARQPVQAIFDFARKHQNDVKACYQAMLLRNPDLMGRVVVKLTVAADGTVPSPAIESSNVRSATLERCIVLAVRRWELPPPAGGAVTVSVPFVLKLGPSVADADVQVDPPSAAESGSLRFQKAIVQTITAHAREVQACSEPWQIRYPYAAATVAVKFEIATDGRVTSAAVEFSSMADGETEQCIVRAVGRWRFPPNRTGKPENVIFPFKFKGRPQPRPDGGG